MTLASQLRTKPWRDKARGAEAWRKSLATERIYARQLRAIARHVGQLVSAFPEGDPQAAPQVASLLDNYATTLTPWAKANAGLLWRKLDIEDFRVWRRHAATMNRELVKEIATAPTGAAYLAFMQSQVDLISSIPRKAAQRVHKLVLEGMENASRGSEIVAEIRRTSEVTQARATLIARTEIARGQGALVQARAEHVGSETYTWRTMGDFAVRPDHRALEGTTQRWDEPPISDRKSGIRSHPGGIYNCRCFAEPQIPDPY